MDLLFGIEQEDSSGTYQDYVDKWRQRMNEAYSIASRNAAKSAGRDKEIYCEINTPEVIHLHPKLHFQSVLYPIEEVDTPDETETETLLDGNIDNGCNGHLHHRSASSTSIRRTDLVTVTTKES